MDNKQQFQRAHVDEKDEQDEDITGEENTNIELNTYKEIDSENNKYPYCIVWTTLPLISWFLPIIGHTGICTSEGVIHDFAGSYYISIDDFAFGAPFKYIKLDHSQITPEKWNRSIQTADQKFGKTMHNLCCNNCHSHVAEALNEMQYQGKKNWNMFDIFILCLLKGKYIKSSYIVRTYIGFVIIVALMYFFSAQLNKY